MNSSSITIGVDANEANTVHRVGSNVYAFELLSHLEKLTRNDESIQWMIYHSKPRVNDLPKPRKGWSYQQISPSFMATQWALPIQLWKNRHQLSVFFTPGHYAPRLCPIPYVTSVMDLAYLQFSSQFKLKDYWQLKHWTAYSVRRAKHVIAISQSTKKDLEKIYHLSPKKITVAYPALEKPIAVSVTKQRKVLKKFSIKKPYILYVGTLQPRKNVVRLIKAYEQLLLEKKSMKDLPHDKAPLSLVLAGKIGWLADDIVKAAKRSPFTSSIRLTGYVSDVEKSVLYENSEVVTLVGLYEGFGMPPLEALAYGKIPVVSETSSLPEVVGKAGILVNPYDIQSIAEGLRQALAVKRDTSVLWKKHKQQQLEKFQWEESAQKVLQVLKKIGENTKRL